MILIIFPVLGTVSNILHPWSHLILTMTHSLFIIVFSSPSCSWASTIWDQRVRHEWRTFTFTFNIPGGSDGKESTCSAGDLGLIPGLGSPLEEGMATHSSILVWRIPMVREAWQTTVHGVPKSQTLLSDWAQHNMPWYSRYFYDIGNCLDTLVGKQISILLAILIMWIHWVRSVKYFLIGKWL